ncbi:MAG: PSD1 domain-containing protein [Planctomycetes bacterium]|nr:PSD1 domain-containing protein [Planctomycetota bacterium]
MKQSLLILSVLVLARPAAAQDKITPEQLEFFEKNVRPVLVQHCFECHAATSKRVKGGLRLDSRAGLLEGGDNGPAIVPGQPEKSRLIEAIRYTNVDLKMPKKGKLPEAIIADLGTWVKMGAPWPNEKLIKKNTYTEFNLQKRKNAHWCWQPIRAGKAPAVKEASWPKDDVDRFLLAKLEAKGLQPARDADPRTLLRRVYFDLIGLPPPRSEVEEFVKACEGANARPQAAYEKVVERLLASPRFGERWARHWLDLVRYAESRGHEFDYTIPNAHHYRDYVIRAFNGDVPYNQFVTEHLAGDLLAKPRMHPLTPDPSSAKGRGGDSFNESILGTAFWFLGEECHSPVDIRQDQADRFDNRIDVMTKTFLGLTVACARCHDHKFDAISTKDYYALFGILESSNYRLARFDTIAHERKIARELWQQRMDARRELQQAVGLAVEPVVRQMARYLLTAADIEDQGAGLDPALLKRWKAALARDARDETSPLFAFAQVAAQRNRPAAEVLAPLLQRWKREAEKLPKGAEVIVDFATDDGNPIEPGFVRLQPGDIILGPSPGRPIGRIVEQAAVERDRDWHGLKVAAGTQNESGALGGMLRAGRTLRTPEFTIKHPRAFALVKGVGMIYAGVGQHIMLAGPLHGSLVQRFNTGGKFQWVPISLQPYLGQRAHLEFTPNDGTDFAIVKVIQCSEPPAPYQLFPQAQLRTNLINATTAQRTAMLTQSMHIGLVSVLTKDLFHKPPSKTGFAPMANWLMGNLDLFVPIGGAAEKRLIETARPILEAHGAKVAQIPRVSRLAPAMQDGSGTDEYVFTRGNPKTLGAIAPRRFLEAFTGAQALKIKCGSGRLELAEQMTNPAVTPLITRVYVNRVWHHLFGRGIVPSVDNFGVLGEAPTHPELLDYLAHRFAQPDGLDWSTKKLIRALVLTRAYQMASTPVAKADEADPENHLWHRRNIRRLEGEAIRDSILSVSGRLNDAMYGPAVPVYLTPFQDGRGRPGSGPLDGAGRRSVYLAVRRNFLSSFLLAFDTPAPFSTVGRRTVSNVPAQALILMNDPFVHQQAEVWAKRVVAEKGSIEDRVRGMYVDAFARSPNAAELRACMTYLGATPDARRWADLGHVLINTKEFYFVN